MVVVAVIGVVLVLAAPSFRELIEMRRLRGVTAQLVTDLQFARSEASSRQEVVGVAFHPNPVSGGASCYSIYALGTADPATSNCDCSQPEGSRCSAPLREIRTVTIDPSLALLAGTVQKDGVTPLLARTTFDPATGGMSTHVIPLMWVQVPPDAGEVWIRTALTSPGARRELRTVVNVSGRPRVCLPSGSVVSGVVTCPP